MRLPAVSRENILAHRISAQGLDRSPQGAERALRLGLQDTPVGSARAAWVQRTGVADAAAATSGDRELVWSWRGAPHLHRAGDLAALAEALWPLNDADATKRIATGQIKEGARRGVEAFTLAATAMRAAVTSRMPKGEVSGAVSAAIPADLCFDCPSCGSRHVSGALFQVAGLAAGLRVVAEGNQTFLEPLPARWRPAAVPTRAKGTAQALRRYVEVLGPATPAHLASFLGTSQAAVKGVVPDGLVEVGAPGGPGWVPEEDLAAMQAARMPRLTRLLPASDPWLQARDRELIVPDPAHRKEVWKALSSPGAVLIDGEVAGIWRAKVARKRLAVAVTGFGSLPAAARARLEEEAQLVAIQRGAGQAEVSFAS